MKNKRSMTFGDAIKDTRPTAFSVMVKPVGSACNLNCEYCYYLDKKELYSGKEPVMDMELLEIFIKQYIEAIDVPEVTFIWHGGEPMIPGVNYYKDVISLQKKYAGGKTIHNVIQTNGSLINEEWCEFLHDNNFLVGISIDGPKEIHDAYRTMRSGASSFDMVIKAISLMAKYNVEYNTMSVVNNLSEGNGSKVYNFLKSIGSHYMQFMPVVEYVVDNGTDRPLIVPPFTKNSRLAEWSVSPVGYGRFMNDIFDNWVLSDVGTYFVQLFDTALAQWCGVGASLCSFSETCGDSLVLEHNGDVYSCDHFVYPEHCLGNIKDKDIKKMFYSSQHFNFSINKHNSLPRECLRCNYHFACRGECPKHRFDKSSDGDPGLNTLCEGYKIFFKHVDPYMKYMSDLLVQERSPAFVMPWARQRMGF